MREAVHYDQRKFRELLVYVAEKVGGDPRFGDVKLNKVLFFSDFRAYNELGHAITGARYMKERLGPLPRPLKPVREELVRHGELEVGHRAVGTKTQRVTTARRAADTSLFTAEELAIVDDVIEWLRPMSATQASEVSHRLSPGWNLVRNQEDIPYSTALISTEPPSKSTIARAREVAATRLGW